MLCISMLGTYIAASRVVRSRSTMPNIFPCIHMLEHINSNNGFWFNKALLQPRVAYGLASANKPGSLVSSIISCNAVQPKKFIRIIEYPYFVLCKIHTG